MRYLIAMTILSFSLLIVGCGGEKEKKEEKKVEKKEISLAEKGEKLFVEKTCNTCHTIGKGKKIGPDLKGITKTHSKDWILAMITNPDSMIKNDPRAKKHYEEFGTPMPDLNISIESAKAIYEFLVQKDKKEEEKK